MKMNGTFGLLAAGDSHGINIPTLNRNFELDDVPGIRIYTCVCVWKPKNTDTITLVRIPLVIPVRGTNTFTHTDEERLHGGISGVLSYSFPIIIPQRRVTHTRL